MAKAIDLPYPPKWINAYITAKLAEYSDTGIWDSELIPIIATKPGNTNEIWNQLIGPGIDSPLVIQYDRLMRFRPSPFYETKREQLIYYLYCDSLPNINNAVTAIAHILDREDVSAQEINEWVIDNKHKYPIIANSEYNVFFHNIKAYQADEVRDLVDLASARAAYVNKIIIEYDYHPKWDNTITPINQNLT